MDIFSTNLPSVPEQSSNPDSDLGNQNIDQREILGITENGVTEKHQKVEVQSIWHRFVSMVRMANKIKPKPEFPEDIEETVNESHFAMRSKTNHQTDARKQSYHNRYPSSEDVITQPCCSSSVIDPEGTLLYAWLAVVTVCWTYSIWMLIVRQAFTELQTNEQTMWLILDYSADFIYVMDFGVQLRTGYLENGLLVYRSSKLARNYTYSRCFIIDILSLTPLDIYFVVTGTVYPLLRFPRFLKFYRAKAFASEQLASEIIGSWWRMKSRASPSLKNPLKYFHKLYRYPYSTIAYSSNRPCYRRAESRTSYPNLLRVGNLCHMLMLLMHWFACFYYMISESEGFFVREGTLRGWAYPLQANATSGSEWVRLRRKYLHSVYWSCLTLTTIGEKQSPDTDIQYMCTLCAYFLGIFVFATVVGQVGNVITNRNVDRLEFERLVDNAKVFMKSKGVSKDMQNRILRWYDYSWSRGILRGAADVNALGMIPDTLKVELAIRVNMDTLRKVSIFKLVQPEFLYALVLKMRSFVFTPGDLVCRKGEVAREMYIINHGVLNVVNDSGQVVASLGAGDFFGEIGVLNIVNGVNKRVADVVSVGYSEVFSLAGKDVLKAMEYYPEAKNLLMIYGRQRFNQTHNSDNSRSTDTTTGSEASLFNDRIKSSVNKEMIMRKREGSARIFRKSAGTRRSVKATNSSDFKLGRTMSSSSISSKKQLNETCALLSISGAAAAVAASVPDSNAYAAAKTLNDHPHEDFEGEAERSLRGQYSNISGNTQEQNMRIEAKLDYLTELTRRNERFSNGSENNANGNDVNLKKLIEQQEKEILEKDKEIESLKQDVHLLVNKLTLSMTEGDSGEFVRSAYPQAGRRKSTIPQDVPRKRNKEDHVDVQNMIHRFMGRRQATKKLSQVKLSKSDSNSGILSHQGASSGRKNNGIRMNKSFPSADDVQLTSSVTTKGKCPSQRRTVQKSQSECSKIDSQYLTDYSKFENYCDIGDTSLTTRVKEEDCEILPEFMSDDDAAPPYSTLGNSDYVNELFEMSSSSSDEDDVRLRQIQEATSEQLRSAMKEKCDEVSSQSGNQSKLKLMRVSEQPSSHFELQTTPEFKCYVAKKLDEHLNSFLKDVEITSVFPKQDVGGGIRLLTSSTEFAAVDEDTCLVDKTPKRTARCRKSSSSSSEDDMEKFAAVCVSGQTILDGGEGVFKDNRSTIKNQTAHTAKRKRRKKDKADMDHVT